MSNLKYLLFLIIFSLGLAGEVSAGEICVVDTGGVNDENGQDASDLTQQCVNFDNVQTLGTYDATINFDEVKFNSASDACLLFDTDFDGFINFTVCVSVKTVAGSPAIVNGPVLAECDDMSLQNCTGENIVPITGDTACTIAIEATDPFPSPPPPGGDEYPDDTVVSCTIDIDDIPLGSLQVNNCSYASASATSAPKDCSLAVVEADLSVTKTDNLSVYPNPPSSVTYTITVSNAGPDDVPAANIVDYIPVGASGASWTCAADPGSNCLSGTGTGDLIDYPFIQSGDTVIYTMTVSLPAGFTGELFNRATAVGTSDVNTANNTDTDIDSEPGSAVDLIILKEVSDLTPNIGETVTFTLTVSNAAGGSDATAVEALDILPAGFTYVTGSMTGGDVRDESDPTGAGLQWTINSLPAGAAAEVLTFQATVNSP